MIDMLMLTCCVLAVIMAVKEFWIGMAIAIVVGIIILIVNDVVEYYKGEE